MVVEARMGGANLLEVDVEVWAGALLELNRRLCCPAHNLLELLLLVYHLYAMLILLRLWRITNSGKVSVHSHD